MKNIIPSRREFWLFHSSGCTLVLLSYMGMHLYYGENLVQKTLLNFIGLILFTITALIFRLIYIRRQWKSLSNYQIIGIVLGYSIISGITVASLLLLITKPFFLDKILLANSIDSPFRIITGLMIFFSFTYQVIACGWGFIYTFIIENRRVKETELNNLRLQNSLKEARLTSLSNQLNPHFLFNALNNIRFMIHETPDKADVMITSLSEVLRYSLESSKQDKVPLRNEIEIIECYIALVKIQFEARLDFSMNIPGNLHGCLIPPMTLQLLVENAIKHGLDKLPRGGKLIIQGIDQRDKLQLQVRNDIPELRSIKSFSTHIGLNNIEQRIQLLYGDKASITFTEYSEEFHVTLMLPKEQAR